LFVCNCVMPPGDNPIAVNKYNNNYSWFQQTFAVFSIMYAFFWVISRLLNFICQRFGTLCLFHLLRRVGTKTFFICHSAMPCMFTWFHKTVKRDYYLRHVCPTALDGFPRNSIFENFSEIYRENSSFITIWNQ
jgi:hypothetical protein